MFNLLNRNPFAELARMERDMRRAFSAGFPFDARGGSWEYPALNVYEGDEDMVIRAHVPGISAEALEITAQQNVLTVKGQRAEDAEKDQEGRRYHRREILCGNFVRSLRLPEQYDAGNAQAEVKNGVLTITVPRRPETKPRRLTVSAG